MEKLHGLALLTIKYTLKGNNYPQEIRELTSKKEKADVSGNKLQKIKTDQLI